MKRSAVALLALLISTLFFTTVACAAKPVVTIATYSMPRYQIMVDKLLPAWKAAHPDIDIQVVNFPDFWNKLLVMLGTGDAPDIVDTAGTYIFGHVIRGGAVDLGPYINSDPDLKPSSFLSGPVNETRWPQPDGQGIYGVPYDTVASVLWYNKSLFDQAGVDHPSIAWSWDDLRAAAKRIARDKDGDGVNEIWGYTGSPHYFGYDVLVKSFGGKVLNPDRMSAGIDSPEAISATQFLADMMLVDRSTGSGIDFAKGNLGMLAIGSANVNTYNRTPGLDWGCTVLPKGPVTRNTYGGSNMWEVMKRPNQDMKAIVTMLKELVSKDTVEAFWTSYSMPYSIPSSRTVASQIKLNDVQRVIVQSIEYMSDADWSPDWSQWQNAKIAALTPVLRGERSAAEGVRQAAHAINVVLDNAYGRK